MVLELSVSTNLKTASISSKVKEESNLVKIFENSSRVS